jgi:hypothetical protein
MTSTMLYLFAIQIVVVRFPTNSKISEVLATLITPNTITDLKSLLIVTLEPPY